MILPKNETRIFDTYILENGKIALEGGKEILKNEKIRDIYFGGDVTLQLA